VPVAPKLILFERGKMRILLTIDDWFATTRPSRMRAQR
jgi:hypothetical protein